MARLERERGSAHARRWYRRQVLGSLVPNVLYRPVYTEPTKQRSGLPPMYQYLDELSTDFRHGLRSLARSPGFVSVAVLTIAIGIGSNTAIFSILDAVLLSPLPFPEAERLVLVHNDDVDAAGATGSAGSARTTDRDRGQLSFPDYSDLSSLEDLFTGIAAWEPARPNLKGEDVEPRRLEANSVTYSMFETLGIDMPLGRGFTADEDTAGAEAVVVISDRFWKEHLGQDPEVLGRTLSLGGREHTIIGVLPERLSRSASGGVLPSPSAAVWIPWRNGPSAEVVELRGVHRARVVARLADGLGLDVVNDRVAAFARTLADEHPDTNTDKTFWIEPARQSLVRNVQKGLYLLYGAVGLVLALVCTNVSSLLLSRTLSRQREIAMRTALGAGKLRILRGLLTESLLVAALGGVLGVALAVVLLRVMLTAGPGSIPRLQNAGLSNSVLGYSVLMVLATTLLLSVTPAFHSLRRDLSRSMNRTRGPLDTRLRQTLVVAQVAIALVLLTGAGLLLRSFQGALELDTGFDDEQLLGISMEMPLPFVSPEWPRAVAFYQQVVDEVAALPAVISAAAAYRHPLDAGWGTTFAFSSRPAPSPGDEPQARFRPVTPGYFETVGVPILRGRDLRATDASTSAGAVVVNETFVDVFFESDQEALGSRIDYPHWWRSGPSSYEIVGIAKDVLYEGLANDERRPALYFAHAQQPVVEMNLLLRYEGSADALLPVLRQTIWQIDAEMPLDNTFEMTSLLDATVEPRRFSAGLLVAFALTGLLLSALSLYSLLAFLVHGRRREIGVRLAVGASLAEVARLVIRQGVALAGVGIALGLAASLFLGRALESQLFNVSPLDPIALAAAPLTLGITVLLASWLPARRASRIDPCVALRED